MELDIKKLEIVMSEFFTNENILYRNIADNIYLFYMFAIMLIDNIPNYDDAIFEVCSITKKNVFENLDLIKNYYKKNNVELDVESLINNGNIDYIYSDRENSFYISGQNYYENDQKLINTCNNGYLTDSVVLIHELSHYRNQTDYNRSPISDLFTESLAIADELHFLDFLSGIGYEEDANLFKNYVYAICADLAKEAESIFRLAYLYSELSSLSKENYKFWFEDDSYYEQDIEILKQFINKKRNPLIFSWAVMGYCLGTYMYIEYRKDNKFYERMRWLHILIDNNDVYDCLSFMGLKYLNNEDLNKIEENLKIMASELGITDLKRKKQRNP